VLLAACSGATVSDTPRGKPILRLVECSPALPLFVEVDGRVTSHGRLDGEGMGWAGGGRKPVRKASTVSFGLPTTSGMIDAMVVRRTVQTRINDLQSCFDRELQTNPNTMRVSMNWRFTVTQDGRVPFAEPTSQQLSSATSTCIGRTFRALQFPARTSAGSLTITLPVVFDSIQIADRPSVIGSAQKIAWTPFAIGAFAPERATNVARATAAALRGRADKLEACFTPAIAGSLRTLLGVQSDGTVAMIRAGGIGDDAVETCVEKELAGAKVVNPLGDATEIACDFARGDAQPWRVTPTASYGVIAATRKDMSFGKQSIVVGALEPDTLPGNQTYLIVAEPDTPGSVLSNALAWASEGDASLVALRDGTRAPVYLGMGRIGYDDAAASRPMLMLERDKLSACHDKQIKVGKLADAGKLAMQLAKRCKSTRCGTLVIGVTDLALAKDLVEVTGAARRAGFDHVVISARIKCAAGGDLDELEEP
jgi:hypothetical protein